MKATYIQQQQLIQRAKQSFTEHLCDALGLIEVQAPILSEAGSGVQDDLSGWEKPVSVQVSAIPERDYQVVHSLAKWKRQTLAKYQFEEGEGIVAQMRALRPDEEQLGPKHSVYVDQWDWEKVISDKQRSIAYLQETVGAIYSALKQTEASLTAVVPHDPQLPDDVVFVHSETLAQQYPQLTPKQREREVVKEHGAVFIIGIGADLSDGQAHDVRAPDYDDWSTPSVDGFTGLNGDLLVWHAGLDDALELSSMGIRVDQDALLRQLEKSRQQHRAELPWHQALLTGELPLTIGGGIGQSRVVMQLLQLDHIGKVQCSVWPDAMEGVL